MFSIKSPVILLYWICRQLGYRNSTKLIPLVQELGQQIHLFLAEYNRYNSDSTSNSNNPTNNPPYCDNEDGNVESDAMQSINLPGFRRRSKTKRYSFIGITFLFDVIQIILNFVVNCIIQSFNTLLQLNVVQTSMNRV